MVGTLAEQYDATPLHCNVPPAIGQQTMWLCAEACRSAFKFSKTPYSSLITHIYGNMLPHTFSYFFFCLSMGSCQPIATADLIRSACTTPLRRVLALSHPALGLLWSYKDERNYSKMDNKNR